MGITVVALGLKHDAGVIIATAGHVAHLTTSDNLREVLMTREQDFDVLVQTATTIMTGVDDDTLLEVVLAQNVGIDITEAGIVHTLDMHIPQATV